MIGLSLAARTSTPRELRIAVRPSIPKVFVHAGAAIRARHLGAGRLRDQFLLLEHFAEPGLVLAPTRHCERVISTVPFAGSETFNL